MPDAFPKWRPPREHTCADRPVSSTSAGLAVAGFIILAIFMDVREECVSLFPNDQRLRVFSRADLTDVWPAY